MRTHSAIPPASSAELGLEQLEFIYRSAGVVSWMWDVASDTVQWFGQAAELFGVEPVRFRGHFADYLEVLHPDDREPARATLLNALKNVRPHYHVEERLVRPDGSLRWVETFGRFEFGADGRARRGVGMLLDVTERKIEEERRRQSDAKFSSAFELSPDAMTLSRISDSRYVAANDRWLELTGYSRDEVIGHSALDLGIWVYPEDRLKLAQLLVKDGMAHDVTMHFRMRDGRQRVGLLSGALLHLDGAAHLLGVIRDVTEELRREAVRRAADAKLAGAFAAVPDAIYLTDRKGVVIDANAAWEEMTGFSRLEVIGQSLSALGVWFDGPRHAQLDLQLTRDGSVREFDMEMRTRTGQRRLCRVHAVSFDAADEANALIVVRDVTEEHRTQERLAMATSVTGIGIWELSARSRRVECDSRFCALLGLPTNETSLPLGRVLASVEPETRTRLDAQYARALAERGAITLEAGGVATDSGELRYVSMHGKLMVDASGEPERWIGIAYDVTPLKRAELALRVREHELEELNAELESRVMQRTAELQRASDELVHSMTLAALGRMVAGVAHEINTPVGNSLLAASSITSLTTEIRGMIGAGLKRSALQAYLNHVDEGATIISKSLRRAAELVASFKQVAVDQVSDQRRAFALAEVIAEIILTLSPTLKGTPWQVVQQVESGLELESYPGSLGQVLINLINNALLHGFDGRDTGTITVSGRGVGADQVCVTVEDDGHGIPAKDLKRIFDPFFTTRLGKGGSGLGLSIVYNLVTRQLAGSIRVDSEPGRGTRFEITIPKIAS